MTMYSCKY